MRQTSRFGRWSGGCARLVAGACLALLVEACGGGGGGGGTPAPVDHARLDACVLVGANVNDGCTTVGPAPVVQLGDLAMGDSKSRVVALYNGGDGDVSATVSAVAFAPAQATNHTLALFKIEGGVETPAALPFELRPNHATELRVRVQFTANVALGPVSGVSVAVTATHPQTTASIAITANVTGCPSGLGDCDQDPSNACETDLQTTLAHCGGCNAACDATHGTPGCTAGVCGIACDAGFGNCDGGVGNGCEVAFSDSTTHCGACGNACDATNGTPSCTAAVCGIACNAGFGDCDANAANGCETNLTTDLLHCGACATACGTANGTPSCTAGACGIACESGFADCDGQDANGCEVELATDLANCGTCGTACSTANGTASCTAGVCGITCNAGFADCDGNVANGCEVNLGANPLHCGACATACNTTNGTASCTSGACGITCSAGFSDCDGNVANGCEVDLNADPAHCGGCGTVCNGTNGTATCSAGTCGITCNAGFGDCDGSAANGCEVNLDTDLTHCGSCATACNATNGTASCTAGVCGIACTGGYGDCDGLAATGCEVNLNTDTGHCGACIVACNGTNGAASCTGGVCGITCAPGFDDCDGTAANGCEVNLNTDPTHCGSCIGMCSTNHGTASCAAGACGITCNAGFADCDASVANGCEIDLQTDPANCSACGAVCSSTNGTASCTAATCGISCDTGFASCDGLATTGCEVNLGTDVANCGACNAACNTPNATPACSGGSCGVASCNGGFGDCDADAANGCELDLTSDVSNCGACGSFCVMYANVADVACAGSTCGITACAAGWTNSDGLYADGCECKTQEVSASCAAPYAIPTPGLGAFVLGPVDGIANPGDAAYYTVSFPYGGMPYIALTRNDGGQATFDVITSCASTPAGCVGNEAGGVTEWRFYDSYSGLSRSVAWPSTVIVRVNRAATSTTCATYQLLVAR